MRAYNGTGPAAENYATQVLADAHRLTTAHQTGAPTGCAKPAAALTGPAGHIQVLPGADLPAKPLRPVLLHYLARMAGLYGAPLIVSTGTNHSQYTTSGNVSDHYTGHAADLGMTANHAAIDSPVGDAIMTACLQVAGEPAARAHADAIRGGLYTLTPPGVRVQCIWKTYEGGDHHNHVHVGVQPR